MKLAATMWTTNPSMMPSRRHQLHSALVVGVLAWMGILCSSQSGWAGDPIEGIGPVGPIEKLAGDFAFTEGPAVDDDGVLYFTDIPADRIHRWTATEGLSVYIEGAGYANGLMWTPATGLRGCLMDGRLIAIGEDKQITTLAETYNGTRFNAPNDLVIDAQGGTYFTDPLYRAPMPLPQEKMSVYYVDKAGEVTRVVEEMPAPNGIVLSPDEKTLYVIPSQDSKVMAFDVTSPGVLGPGRVLCEIVQTADSDGKQGGDGATVDTEGNLYFTTALGVQVFAPSGNHLGTIEFPEHPANVTFGGPDFKTLIVTARTSVYQAPMAARGHRYSGAE